MALTDAQRPNTGVPMQVVIDALDTSGSGVAFSQVFALPWNIRETIQAQLINGGSGAFSAFNVDLQVSLDGGTTFVTMASYDLVAIASQLVAVQGGALYRFKVTTATVSSGVPKGEIYITI